MMSLIALVLDLHMLAVTVIADVLRIPSLNSIVGRAGHKIHICSVEVHATKCGQ